MDGPPLPPRATRALVPGLARRRPGYERYRVPGGGALAVALEAGDRVRLSDPEGGQAAEVTAFAVGGRADPGLLGLAAVGPAEGLAALMADASEEGRAMATGLSRRGLLLAGAPAMRAFGRGSDPGESLAFAAEEAVVLLVGAPGGSMAPDGQDPPTDLLLEVERARPLELERLELPEPLAEPRLEMRVDRASALAYEVGEGEHIQVIDVAGRQCSDFLAFDARRLAAGTLRGLDATATRTLGGRAWPVPGLYAKFFDEDFHPLVEVIRDTCGRHDTFALACTAKYYEDMGYPGHPNCSDNFSAALAPFGIGAKRGWPAVNFFYNTAFDASHALILDEPWSRPGDYVLLRAATDLVCASSACPDDIDAANGWNPTEVHVRIYPAGGSFKRGVASRMTPDAEPRLTRESGFHPRTSAATRDLVEYRGFWLANSYTGRGPLEEYRACRERCAVIDLSALRKFEILGPDAEALMQHALTRDVRRLAVGQVVYSAICYEHGGMIDDGTLMRLGPDNFRWVCGDDYCGIWLRELAQRLRMTVLVKTSTDQLHNIAVQGPRSREILKGVVWTPPARPSLAELGWFRLTVGRIGGPDGIAVVVTRTGYTGELGYELWCHPKDAPAVWDAVLAAGEPHGIAPLGLAGLDILRVEAGLVFAGADFSDQTDPFEAGIGFTVPLAKTDDFIGRQALAERRAHPRQVLVGLELDGNEAAGHGDCVHIGRAQVGVVTSGTRSPVLARSIALARLDVHHVALGTNVEVGKLDGHQKRLPARVVRFPFYDSEKTRVRG
jgi:aminomethyltransferase